jgi:hypothetical protein
MSVIYALHARACIERERACQAEHYVGAVRDHALALACLPEGVLVVQARSYDDLSEGASRGAQLTVPGLCRARSVTCFQRRATKVGARGHGGGMKAHPGHVLEVG